ncbi:MAG: RNA methyltransferase [Pseudomonadota bacterium]
MRGYFGIGVESVSKPMNVGNLLRSAHAFGASFFFTVSPSVDVKSMRESDTSGAFGHIPFYNFQKPEDILLPRQTSLVGIEFLEEAIELPSFRHPQRAVYVLGRERGNLSGGMLARCDHVVKIPMRFCINVGVAGALVMYDRLISFGRFADRPVREGGPEAFSPERLREEQIVSRLARHSQPQ